jgi:hypothetical protein
MREARCLQSNNTREARSITYSTSSSSTHENSTHTDTTEATPLGRLRSPWIPPFDPPPSPPSNPTPDPSLRLRPYGTFVSSARIVKDSRTLQWTSSSVNAKLTQKRHGHKDTYAADDMHTHNQEADVGWQKEYILLHACGWVHGGAALYTARQIQ